MEHSVQYFFISASLPESAALNVLQAKYCYCEIRQTLQYHPMSRIILSIEAVLAILAVSFFSAGGNTAALAAISPMVLIPAFPVIASSGIWPTRKVIAALTGRRSGDSESIRILRFCGSFAVLGGAAGALLGVIALLLGNQAISSEMIRHAGKNAATALTVLMVFTIIVRQLSEIRKKRPSFTGSLDSVCAEFGITRREKEIFGLIAQGCSNREIARKLDISEDTVRNHLHSVFQKTGVKNRNGLAGLLSAGE
jgi:DNA-binding CsgD family transcriptional regulator